MRVVKSGRLNFSSRTEVQITIAEHCRRLDHFIFTSVVFDLSYFYAMIADFHTRLQ